MGKTSTLSTGEYTIKLDENGASIFAVDANSGAQRWIAATLDPTIATNIVEGLILVEYKRFYHPEAIPVFSPEEDKPLPPFLKKVV